MSFHVREPVPEYSVIMPNYPDVQPTLLELAEALPHGSGIDSKWTVAEPVIRKDGGFRKVEFHNSYHRMNDAGMYCGWYDFKVVLFRHETEIKHKLCGLCEGQSQITFRKGDWDFRVTGLTGRLSDVGDWVHGCVSESWAPFHIGKMRVEIV